MKKITVYSFGKIKNTAIKAQDLPISSNKLIFLSEQGREFKNTLDFKDYLFTRIENEDEVNFILGNAFGFNFKEIGNCQKISLSQLTFTHELSLVLLLEQIYRCLDLRKGGKYHK